MAVERPEKFPASCVALGTAAKQRLGEVDLSAS
jgi:hypothetical protein